MKVEDALYINQRAFLVDANGNTNSVLIEAISLACVALERMIPMKPIHPTYVTRCLTWICPRCQMTKHIKKSAYCDECGQKLDWEAWLDGKDSK